MTADEEVATYLTDEIAGQLIEAASRHVTWWARTWGPTSTKLDNLVALHAPPGSSYDRHYPKFVALCNAVAGRIAEHMTGTNEAPLLDVPASVVVASLSNVPHVGVYTSEASAAIIRRLTDGGDLVVGMHMNDTFLAALACVAAYVIGQNCKLTWTRSSDGE